MNRLILIDACRLPRSAIRAVEILRTRASQSRVVTVGVMPRIRWWQDQLPQEAGDRLVEPLELTQGATKVTLTLEAMSLLEAHREGWHWIIIGCDRAYIELARQLEQLGAEVDYLSTIGVEQATAMAGNHPSISQRMRELAQALLETTARRSIHLGEFGNRVVHCIPEMEDRELRTKMFGSARFGRIARSIGVRVSGDRIIGVD